MALLKERDDLLLLGKEHLEKRVLPALRDTRVQEHPRWKFPKKGGPALPVLHPSEAAKCERAITYALFQTTSMPEDVKGAMRLYDGEPHGASVIHWLQQMGYKVTDVEARKRKIIKWKNARFYVSARIDGIIECDDGGPMILECKGLSTFTMKRTITDIVNKDYRAQAQLYMHLWGIPRTLFAIKDKNSSEIRLFEFDYRKNLAEAVIARWAKIVGKVKCKEFGIREFPESSLECSWCRYSHVCRGKK